MDRQNKSKHYLIILLEAEEVPHKMWVKKLFGCGSKMKFLLTSEEIRGKTVLEEKECLKS